MTRDVSSFYMKTSFMLKSTAESSDCEDGFLFHYFIEKVLSLERVEMKQVLSLYLSGHAASETWRLVQRSY